MYERMLDKQHCPSSEEMSAFYGENARRFDEINALLQDEFQTETAPAFPYGNHYGWCVAHRRKGRLCCSVFPEDGGWIHCRSTGEDTLAEAWNLICARFGNGPKGAN